MKLFIAILLLLPFTLPIAGTSQINVSNTTPYDSEQYLVEDLLLGNGVSASNITFSGDPSQIGFFNGVNSNIGLDSGIVMYTADIATIVPGGVGTDDFLTPASQTDSDLITVVQSVTSNPNANQITETHDLADLNFDFQVVGDTVEFEFVFASDEYLTYINTQYNDVFSFFLSGPGISGPYSSPAGFPNGAVNVALIPNTTDPITISSVHPGLNSQYYIDNPANATVSLNGFTTVVKVKYPVECGENYHFRFAIADCGDGSLASAVFLKAGSLGSDGIGVSSFANFAGVQGGNIIGEACGQAGFVFSSSNINEPDTIRFTISGNAEMFDDYLSFPDSIILPVGVASDTIWVTILQDFLFEDMDTLEITLLGNLGCNRATLYIQSINQLNASLTVDSVNICPPETGQLVAEIAGGWEPYYVSWNNNGGLGDTVLVSPDITTFYNASVTDACGSVRILESSEVWVQCPVAIANVFTPNGDGINDLYSAVNLDDYPNPTITIYNRWGKIVYYMEDYQNDWDGTHYKSGNDLKEGVYYIVVSPNSPKYQYTEHKDTIIQRTLSGYLQLMR